MFAFSSRSTKNNREQNSRNFRTEQVARRWYPTNTRISTWCTFRLLWAVSQDLRRHFPGKFRRALNLDEIKPSTVHRGPFSALLARLGLVAPSPPSPRCQPTFSSPLRGHRERTTRSDDASLEAERSSRSDCVTREAPGAQQYTGRNGRALSIPLPRRPHRKDRPAISGQRGRMSLTAPAGRKELGR